MSSVCAAVAAEARWGLMITALRPLRAMRTLLVYVETGSVTGVMANTTPTGLA
jgi:hypothetical protein